MTLLRLVLIVAIAAGAVLAGASPAGVARGQLPTLHISGVQVFLNGQPVAELAAGTRGKRYTVEIIGVGFDASAKVFVNGSKVPVLTSAQNHMTARLKGVVLVAGQITLQVVNPDGETSNAVTLDVASDPSVLSISSVSPVTGMVGTQVTVTGVGFTPTGNMIQMVGIVLTTLRGVTGPVASPDGKTLTFHIPSALCPPCAFSTPPCLAPCFVVSPGTYRLSVTNSNGVSNSVLFLVSAVSISSVSPDNGPIGTQITLAGVGFTPDGNVVEFDKASDPNTGGFITPLQSADGKTLTFNVPDSLLPPCFLNGCKIPNTPLTPGSYQITVLNGNGLSNRVSFLVDSPGGPIGVWGTTGEKVTVTDTQVIVEGLCFSGLIQQTLVPDAMGNFNLSGTFTPLVGPSAVPRPAQFLGSISGATMTLNITTGSQTLGPVTLTFGNDVPIFHPCV